MTNPRRPTVPRSCWPPLPDGYSETEPQQWHLEDLDRLIGWCLDVLKQADQELPGRWVRVIDWTPGVTAGTDVKVSGGGIGDDGATNGSTQARALAALKDNSPTVAHDFHTVVHGVLQIARAASHVKAALGRLADAQPTEGVSEASLRGGVGECGNPQCGHVCTGKGNDRRRKGRCRPCYKWRAEHRGEERPHEVCHAPPVGPVDGCRQCWRAELVEKGHDLNDVVSLVDDRVRAAR